MDGEPTRGSPAPSSVASPAAMEPSTTIEDSDHQSGQAAPDFGVSEAASDNADATPSRPQASRFRLVKPDRPTADIVQLDEDGAEAEGVAPSWKWNGRDYSVTESPGSTRTRKFVLLLKGTDGKYHYARSCSLNFEEYNRRFAGRPGVPDKCLKVVRKSDYEKYKKFIFEAWRSTAIRADTARAGHSASPF